MSRFPRAPRGALAALALVASLATGASEATAAPDWTKAVESVPGFRIPKVIVTARSPEVAPGLIFATPRTRYPGRTGPTILDQDGHVVWFHRQGVRVTAQNLHPQVLFGRPVLTWSNSPPLLKEGDTVQRGSTARNNYDIIADDSYRVIKRVRAKGKDVITDGHEFVITKENTALVLGGRFVHRRVRAFGVERSGFVDNLVQEIDLRTDRVIFSWSAARHIPLSESMVRPPHGNWDPFHLNSISVDTDGNLLVSARHTSAVYKIARHSGRIIWKLGGKNSTFKMGPDATFYYQHDAQRQADGTITVFDNHSTAEDPHGNQSFGKRLRIFPRKRLATLVQEFRHPSGRGLATSQGNINILPNGNAFIGWGINPWFGEYAPDGHLLFGARFWSVYHHSYRVFKAPWVGAPATLPALKVRVGAGRVAAYASWNGATEVTQWRLLAGSARGKLHEIGIGPKTDFETHLSFDESPAPEFARVDALDKDGNVLGSSLVVKTAPS